MLTRWPIFLALVALIFLTVCYTGCQKDVPIVPDMQTKDYNVTNTLLSESIVVFPEGTSVTALKDLVTLSFPPGIVDRPTMFLVSSFCTEDLGNNGINCLGCGIRIQSEFGACYFSEPYQLQIRYCKTTGENVSIDGECLTLYHMKNVGMYEKDLVLIDGFCVDCQKRMITASIHEAVISLIIGTD